MGRHVFHQLDRKKSESNPNKNKAHRRHVFFRKKTATSKQSFTYDRDCNSHINIHFMVLNTKKHAEVDRSNVSLSHT